ncbi:acyltransferase [Escherichia coli]|uniref:acyltransferase n=1 Tax=Escherichia coli TaxID=562 RepID=UPI000CF0898C|nr:acyltransferase [Escherichia coli]MBL7376966.1 acyltransferase [Escherichia coli]PPV66108.1 hypothetical protein C5P22_05005 [Escherichia coli]QSC85765.1 acyltransferase [Escherichia coli]HCJ9609226.1 acyltransferase [Escherichia coli]HDL8927622.1 acyltransferase [Escherichia coli]
MKRIHWMDFARFIAIILVIFTHAHETVAYGDTSVKSIFYTIDRMAVPLFLFISGGLILPQLHDKSILSFYKKRIPQFLLLIAIYSIVTSAIKYSIDGRTIFDALMKGAIENNGFVNNNTYPGSYGYARQMWYMYMIVQIYLVAPFISKMVVNTKTSHLYIFIALCLLLNQFKITSHHLGQDFDFISKLGTDYTGPFLSYFISGYIIANRELPKLAYNNYFCLIMVLVPCAYLYYNDVINDSVNWSLHWYPRSLPLFVSSLGLCLLIKNMFNNINNSIINNISLCSFGVFLAHYAFIYITIHACGLLDITENKELLLMLATIAPLLLSLLYVNIMMKYRITKKLVS